MKTYKCHTCANMAAKTTSAPAQFLLYGCKHPEHRITFGIRIDYKEGKNCKAYCKEYVMKGKI